MSEPALKCENSASFKQSYTLKLFIAFKIAYSCCLSSGGNLDFPDFLQKSFITSTTGLSFYLESVFAKLKDAKSKEKFSTFFASCPITVVNNVTRLGNLLDFGQLFKAFGSN